jgi:beta-ureidopropionase / N-carbamoyl-L-amino-acid hydrolase
VTVNTPQRIGNLRVDATRLWARHMQMAQIGAIEGDGNCRLALSAEDTEARQLFAGWCRDAGLDVTCDRAGNMFAVRPGQDPSLPVIAAGSHLDTQPHGGRFDGISGVLAALEAVETLNEAGITTRAPLAVINWTNEEGVRFAPGLMGSSWFVGEISDQTLDDTRATDGAFFGQEVRARGWYGEQGQHAFPMAAFFELHIEQGPQLERSGQQLGIVTSVQGLKWLDVKVTGMDAHAGTTPLAHRKDALLAAARMLTGLNDVGRSFGPEARVSVGRIVTATDGPSTIVGECSFIVDIRHPDNSTLARLSDHCIALCRQIADKSDCSVDLSERISVPARRFDDNCIAALETAARNLGLTHVRMASGALHDASNIAKIAPTAMIFVPCRDGISHNVAEYASPEDLAAGATVLMHAMVEQANR